MNNNEQQYISLYENMAKEMKKYTDRFTSHTSN